MTPTVDTLNDLYGDTKTCAQLIGLSYVEDESSGSTRVKHGKGFSYRDLQDQTVVDQKMKAWITELVIPPAWQSVWICPDQNGHVLATGTDERGRKQYIYHPKWRTMRDIIKFYRMIVFATALPKIRRDVTKHLKEPGFGHDKIIAAMVWLLDNSYIRIGNEVYFQENESVGLTTLIDSNIVVAGPVVTLSFKGKSGKNQQITFEDAGIAKLIDDLQKIRGARLFRYQDDSGWHDIDAHDINNYLHDITQTQVSAKDFRTWGGTLMAFDYLIAEDAKKHPQKPEKAVIAAVDQAAAILGNTRTVARSSYVHPHLLAAYGHKDFGTYYSSASKAKKLPGLDRRESELLRFLEELFEKEFDLLKQA